MGTGGGGSQPLPARSRVLCQAGGGRGKSPRLAKPGQVNIHQGTGRGQRAGTCYQPTVTDHIPGSWGSTATTMAELGMLSSSFRPWPFSRTFPATVSEPLGWATPVQPLVPAASQDPPPSGLTMVQSPSHSSHSLGSRENPPKTRGKANSGGQQSRCTWCLMRGLQLIAFLFKCSARGSVIPLPTASCLSQTRWLSRRQSITPGPFVLLSWAPTCRIPDLDPWGRAAQGDGDLLQARVKGDWPCVLPTSLVVRGQ